MIIISHIKIIINIIINKFMKFFGEAHNSRVFRQKIFYLPGSVI